MLLFRFVPAIPEDDLVIVRIGDDKTAPFDLDGLIRIARGAWGARNAMESPSDLNPGSIPLAATSPADFSVESNEVPPVLLEHALGFGAKTACSCAFVSLNPWEYCEQYLQLPSLPALEYRRSVIASERGEGQHPIVEARLNGLAKAAVFYEGEGCVLMNDQSYKAEGLRGKRYSY